MPIYEYHCHSCGHYHEALQRLKDEPLVECPQCQQPELVKCISAPNFHLKGTGWYATDFKDKDKSSQQNTANSDSDQGSSNQSDNNPSQNDSNTSSQAASTSTQ